MKRHQPEDALERKPLADNYQTIVVDEEAPPPAVAPVVVKEESHLRSLLKGFTWRLVASTTTITISWYITGQVQTALQIGFIEFFFKIFIFYVHERVWARIKV